MVYSNFLVCPFLFRDESLILKMNLLWFNQYLFTSIMFIIITSVFVCHVGLCSYIALPKFFQEITKFSSVEHVTYYQVFWGTISNFMLFNCWSMWIIIHDNIVVQPKVFCWNIPMRTYQTEERIKKILEYLDILEEEGCIPHRIIHLQKDL